MRHFVLTHFMNPYLATLFTFLLVLAFLRLAMQAGSAYEVLRIIIYPQPKYLA